MSIIGRIKDLFVPARPIPPGEEIAACERMLSLVDLHEGDIAIDCGANVGNITAMMARSGAEVYAFEPNPYAYKAIKKRFRQNDHVHCYNQAIHDHFGVMRLYLHQRAGEDQVYWSTGSSLLEYKGNVSRDTFVEIEVVDLVSFVCNLDHDIKLVKMDVEGVECPIINKLIDTGTIDRIGMLLVETHDDKVPELKCETDALRKRIALAGLSNINLNWI